MIHDPQTIHADGSYGPGDRAAGTSRLRKEDHALLTGRGRYVDDIVLPGLLHCAFVRSGVAHGLIERIDCTAARAMPGVHAVLTLDDLMPMLTSNRMPLGTSTSRTANVSTPFVLSNQEVAYVGEPIVLVVAESRYQAEDAAAAVVVDIAALPAVADARSAMKADSVLVRRELKTNINGQYDVAFGDIDAAFAKAAHIFSDTLWQHRGCGHSMEGRGVVVEARAGKALNVWSSTQMPHDLFYTLVGILQVGQDDIRVITPDVGGGFGPKYCIYPEEIALPAAALLLSKNLKWMEDRRETFISSIQERDQYWSIEVAVDGEARLLGVRGQLVHDQGAYTPKAVNLPFNSASAMSGPYILPAYKMNVVVAHTNKVPVSSVRGAGYPQAAFAMERTLDRIARELGLDRAEVRRRNLIPAEKLPYVKPLQARSGAPMVYDSGDYLASQARVLAAAGWDGFPQRQRRALAEGRYIGMGLANAVKGTGRGPFESGIVRVNQNGKVSVFTGAAEMGQGLMSTLAQICADELSISPEDVEVIGGDTSKSPLGLGGFASRQLVTAGSSVHFAAKAVAQKAMHAASEIWKVDRAQLELKDGIVRSRVSNATISLGELAQVLRGAPGFAFPDNLEPGLESAQHWRTDALVYANACHVAEVEVEPDLGQVRLLRYVLLNDCGRMINPMIVRGQVEGGVVHGIGNALFELMGYDDAAQPVTTTFQEYLLPTATEIPSFEEIFQETPTPNNPLGAKGVGELGTIPAAAAIISAVEDALAPFGVRISQTPITPEAIFTMVASARAASSSPDVRP